MCHKTGHPRYDDTSCIDSNAVRQAPAKNKRAPMDDPDATAYTEMYCAPSSVIEHNPHAGK